jgi:hypothetical protein
MKRSHVGLSFLTLAGLLAAPAAAFANPIAGAMGNLRWGMNEHDVRTALEAKIKDKSELRALASSYVEFDGKNTSWDHSPVAEEYTHGNEESMLSSKGSDSDNYYFFIGGQLWKWVKLFPASAFGGGHDFDRFASKVRARFGKGYDKEGEVNPGSGASYKFVEFLDRNTRLRAVDKTGQQNQYALVFEAMDTVRSLASLRSSTIRRFKAKATRAVASAEPTHNEAPASSVRAPSRGSATSGAVASNGSNGGNGAAKKRSIFTGEEQGADSQDDYNARKKRAQAEADSKQRHMFERGQESKKGKVLDDLAGMDDSDPIAGAK